MGEGAAGGDSAGEGGEWTRAGDGEACCGCLGAVLRLSGLSSPCVPQRQWSRPPLSRPPCRAQLPSPWEGGSLGDPSASLCRGLIAEAGP